MSNERKGWTEIVTSEDYDKHMANIGQASANSEMVKQMFQDYPLMGSRLLIPGCGTGQMFDYITPDVFGSGTQLTLTDINPTFLEKTKERLRRFRGTNYEVMIDDIEDTKLTGEYGGILIVLVLHNVSWVKSLESMFRLSPEQLYIIEMEQDLSKRKIRKRKIPESMRRYEEEVKIELIPREELIDFISGKGYDLRRLYEKKVPDNKTMVGFVFEK
jgi:SAM-dependent methyltransferase